MARRKESIAAHAGEILHAELLQPMQITAYQLAEALHCPGIYEIVRGERDITGVPNQRRRSLS